MIFQILYVFFLFQVSNGYSKHLIDNLGKFDLILFLWWAHSLDFSEDFTSCESSNEVVGAYQKLFNLVFFNLQIQQYGDRFSCFQTSKSLHQLLEFNFMAPRRLFSLSFGVFSNIYQPKSSIL